MKLGSYALALILALATITPALAQEEPKKEEPAKEEAPAAAAEPEEEKAAPPAEPAAQAEPAKEPPPAPPAPAAPEAPAKELSGCAKSFGPLANSYKAAYDDLQKWIDQIDRETTAASENLEKLRTQIQENEAATTQAKMAKDNAKVKELQKQNKTLWSDFKAAEKTQSDTCAKFVKEAPQRVKQYSDTTSKALDALKSQGK